MVVENVEDLLELRLEESSALPVPILASLHVVPVDRRGHCKRFLRDSLHKSILYLHFQSAALSLDLR